MPNYCPSCGAKVDEGYKFCLSCEAKLETENTPNPENSPEEPIQQGTMPPAQNKSNKNLLFGLIAIIVIVVVIAVIIIITGGSLDGRFIGEWEISSDGFETFNWVFESDGTLKMTGMGMNIDIASWSVRGGQLCLNMKENELFGDFLPEQYVDEICYDFEFSNGENTLTLSIDGSENLVLYK